MPGISLAMCVKDEAATLEAAVESMRSVVDEIVIGVDSSCTDNTAEIAERLASPGKFFVFEWHEDFSEARNLVIEKCTQDYIFILDGHEFMPPDDHPTAALLARMRRIDTEKNQILTPLSLIETIRANGLPEPYDVVCITLAMNTDEVGLPQLFFLQPRLFKNHKGIHYESAVHNFLAGYDKAGALGCAEGLLIHNMPPAREAKRKKQRKTMNISGLSKDVRANSKEARPYFYLGNTYADLGKSEKALYWYEKYLKYSTFGEEKYQVYQQLAVLYHRHRKDVVRAREYALMAMAMQWRRNEPFVLMGEICADENDFEQAIHWYDLAAEIAAPATVMFLQGPAYSYMPDTKRMLCYESMGQWDRAIEFVQRALSWRPGDPSLISKLEEYKEKQRVTSTQNRNLLLVDKIGSFTTDLAQGFGQHFNVDRVPSPDPRWQGWADVAWFEWCDENIVHASQQKWNCPVICRLHSYEAFGDTPAYVKWENVDCLIFVADHIKEMFLSKWPHVAGQTRIEVIPNGVNPAGLTFKERAHGKRIGYLGYFNNKKGIPLLVEAMLALSDYEFHLAGQFQDPHLAYWFQHATESLPNVWWHDWIDPSNKDEWLEGVDYIISPSIVESFGYSLAEAMMKGIKPLVLDRQGAIWPETYRRTSELRALVDPASPYESTRYRDHILSQYSLEGQLSQTLALVEGLWQARHQLAPAAVDFSWLSRPLELPQISWGLKKTS